MEIPGKKVIITPICVKNHGIENRVKLAFDIIREPLKRSLKAYPKANIEVSYKIIEDK